jgi:hypothetical protein
MCSKDWAKEGSNVLGRLGLGAMWTHLGVSGTVRCTYCGSLGAVLGGAGPCMHAVLELQDLRT